MSQRDFPGGPVVKNSSVNEGDVGSVPGPGNKIPYATGNKGAPQQLILSLEHVLCNERIHCNEKITYYNKDQVQPKKFFN